MTSTFKCEQCGGVFDKGRSDEEAAAEAAATFPQFPSEDMALVCDDCYAVLVAQHRLLFRDRKDVQ